MSLLSTNAIRGFVAPLPTVFDGAGAVDDGLNRDVAEFYIEAGVNALFLLGSYGQGPALGVADRERVARVVVDQARGRLPVVVHIGAVDPYTTIELGLHARDLGVDAVAIVGPYYYADRSEEELLRHFEMVDQALQVPILIYNNPRYQGYPIDPQLMGRLVSVAPRIFGAKLALGTLDDALDFVREIPGFAPFALASVLLKGMPLGVRGTVSPPLTLAPELGVSLIGAIDGGRADEARELQAQVTELNETMIRLSKRYGRTPYAEGLRALGFPIRQYPRWPTVPMPAGERDELLGQLRLARSVPAA